jgi:hypothetical protein
LRRLRLLWTRVLLGGILLLRGVASGILNWRRLRWKWAAGYVSRRPWRRIPESAAELGRNRPSRECGADHDQECGDSSHNGDLLVQVFASVHGRGLRKAG